MSLNSEFREIWRQVLEAIRTESRAAVRPFTVGGKLNLGSPHIVGKLPASNGGMAPIIAGPGIVVTTDPVTGAVTITVEAALQTMTWNGDDLTWNGATLTWGDA